MVHPHARGGARRHTRSLPGRARAALTAVLVLWALAGCERKGIEQVPTLGVEPCKVNVGDLRTNVLLRCGPGCGGGDTPSGRCDVYHSVLICYGAEQRVTSLRRLAPYKDEFKWCKW
ncbi:MAG: hypothetical protein L0Y64_09175 [Myxococcaceae bacterium]|nr:hypothetical protein [Myxococcaceae bacterium]